jgi:hypothetical protein
MLTQPFSISGPGYLPGYLTSKNLWRQNGGTLARGLYTIDGVYTLNISATGYRTLPGTIDDLCARID